MNRLERWLGRGPMAPVHFVQPRGEAGPGAEPPREFWADRTVYDERLRDEFIAPLADAAGRDGVAPAALQLRVLEQLHWHFTVDRRAVAPTQWVDDALAATFHRRVAEVMRYVAPETLEALPPAAIPEVRHALLSYKGRRLHSGVSIDAVDHHRQLVRVSYWVHGEPPSEHFTVDGEEVKPAFAKYRACRYFERTLFRQRIAWLPAGQDARDLRVELGGAPVAAGVGPQPYAAAPPDGSHTPPAVLAAARHEYWPGRGRRSEAITSGWRAWKARAVKAAARLPFVRARFRDAWVFADRARDADDNAEHLYRWVRKHHPEINAWFLLNPGTPDWDRLAREGFRLIGPGPLRKLLLLNAAHVISSHPENGTGGFDRRLYGDAMRWRFTYLKHGISKDDQSAYYRDQGFDCVLAPSPAEYESFVADDTAYDLTAREVIRCNLPRHDRLLELAAALSPEEIDEIVVMPTWRGRLIDDDLSFERKMALMRESEYARTWSQVLNDPTLRDLAAANGKKIVFVPHSNLVPYLAAFDLPSHVTVVRKGESIQPHLARCWAFVTDYTSVAFDVALLRRPVFYLQFDKEEFYRGAHNWRRGYFDYERDGFGPVARTPSELDELMKWRLGGVGRFDEFQGRRERAMPDRTSRACGNVIGAISPTRNPQATRFVRPSHGRIASRKH